MAPPNLFTGWTLSSQVLSPPASPEAAAAAPEASAPETARTGARTIAARAGAAGAVEVARALRAVDSRGAILVELRERLGTRAVPHLPRGADRSLRGGPATAAVLLPVAALIPVHAAVIAGVDIAATRAANHRVALRATSRERFAASAALRHTTRRACRVSRH